MHPTKVTFFLKINKCKTYFYFFSQTNFDFIFYIFFTKKKVEYHRKNK